MCRTKIWCCTKNHFASKKRFHVAQNVSVVNKSKLMLLVRVFHINKKKLCCTKTVFHVDKKKQDDLAQNKYFVLEKVIDFFRNGAIFKC